MYHVVTSQLDSTNGGNTGYIILSPNTTHALRLISKMLVRRF